MVKAMQLKKTIFVWLAFFCATSLHAQLSSHERGVFARTPYVQLATPSTIFVVWRTHTNSEPVVRWGTTPDNLNMSTPPQYVLRRIALGTNRADLTTNKYPAHILRLPRLHSAPVGVWQYEAKLVNLRPDTKYYYAVYDGKNRLTPRDESYHFRTHPLPGQNRPLRFWVVGDSGTGREAQSAVHQAMLGIVNQERKPLDFYIHVGDMAYQRGKDTEFQTRFFEMYDTTLRNTVCWASMGNHEGGTSKGTNGVGPYYDAYVLPARGEAGGLPSGTEAFYSYDYGRVHFICLDSHDLDRRPTGMMAQWLKADLERTKADWIIAFFHHPPYTKGSHDSDREKQLIEMRQHIMPILESGGVDLVLTGHSHIYERSMLMDGAYATPTISEYVILDDGDGDPNGDGPYKKSAGIHPNEGTVQVVAGHGGTGLSRKGTMPIMRKTILEHGSVLVDVTSDTLVGKMVNKFGDVRDVFSIVKRGKVTPTRIAAPWQPPIYVRQRGRGRSSEAQPPEDFFVAIPRHASWKYFAGAHPDGDWKSANYNDSGWKEGEAGFGYGENEQHKTALNDMKDKYTTVYLRKEFEIEQADYVTEIGLMIDYDDGFVAYLNGHEVARRGVKGSGASASDIRSRDSGRFGYFALKDFEKHVRTGKNVLAIEGHNSSRDSSDFKLDPYLLLED